MNNHNSGQNGPPGTPGKYERSHRWQDIPLDVLRVWYREQRPYRKTIAAVAKLTGKKKLSPQTIVNFLGGDVQPNYKTRQQLALYYLAKHPWGYVAEKGPPYGTPKPLPSLSEMLPEGHAEARAELEKLVELAKRHPDEAPASSDRVLGWLQKLLDAEYTGEDLSKRPLDANGNPIPNDPPEG
jgi:hypothetical protein